MKNKWVVRSEEQFNTVYINFGPESNERSKIYQGSRKSN